MKHEAIRMAADFGQSPRIAVGYFIPGTGVFSLVSDYPLAAKGAAHQEAERLSFTPPPEPPPEERKIAPGFYADQGQLF